MRCPFCDHNEDKVVDSREAKIGDTIRRRRECAKCGRRFTTYERIDEIPHMVVKKDGRREQFDRHKLMAGLMKACEKRPIAPNSLEEIVNDVEAYIAESPNRERPTSEVGEMVMARLKRLDKVAYVRFASVYLEFEDVREFMDELKDLVKARGRSGRQRAAKAEAD
jgi:transcriptional repressor NrdR